MTLALIATAAANSGPLLGIASGRADHRAAAALVQLADHAAVVSDHRPRGAVLPASRATILDRHRWIVPAVIAACVPMLVIGITSAAFLQRRRRGAAGAGVVRHARLDVRSVVRALPRRQRADRRRRHRALSRQPRRRRAPPHPDRRLHRRAGGVRLCAEDRHPAAVWTCWAGRSQLPWPIEAFLQAIVLLPAFGLPYAVAVRHVFSPRTVLRRSLQYAFARRHADRARRDPGAGAGRVTGPAARPVARDDRHRTAAVLSVLPRDAGPRLEVSRSRRSAGSIRRFFRDEYDAREILVSLAGRVPYEADPRDLVAMVVTQIDSALHPENIAVFASDSPTRLEPVRRLRAGVDAARRGHAAARRQRRDHAAALVRQAARSVPGR